MAATHDRLSALPDATLARVLSHLPTDEAARTSALSRRWRHVHAAVPVVHLVDGKTGDRDRDRHRLRHRPVFFDHKVTAALLCRDPRAPVRALRLDAFQPTVPLLDQWLLVALDAGADEVDVKLRYKGQLHSRNPRLCPFAPHDGASGDFDHRLLPFVRTPARLFRTAALRRLRLTQWTLDVPRDVPSFPSMETLVLERVMARGDALQRLVSGCRNLAALTLEECPTVTVVAVPSARLRSFAIACCHQATRVALETTTCLRSMRYKGGLPPPGAPFLVSLRRHAGVASVTVDICEGVGERKRAQVGPIAKVISRCTNLTSLHLALRPEMASCGDLFAGVLRGLRRLRRLGLEGCVSNGHTVAAVIALLQSTSKLEALSLFPLHPDPPKEDDAFYVHDSDDELCEEHGDDDELGEEHGDGDDGDKDGGEYRGNVFVPGRMWSTDTRCIKRRLRRINLVGYRGRRWEKILAKFLLSKAVALEEVKVSVASQLYGRRYEMARELESWRLNRRTRVITCE
ncbi:hypothetical protein ACP4OV_020418 [Aristida adscensionis]